MRQVLQPTSLFDMRSLICVIVLAFAPAHAYAQTFCPAYCVRFSEFNQTLCSTLYPLNTIAWKFTKHEAELAAKAQFESAHTASGAVVQSWDVVWPEEVTRNTTNTFSFPNAGTYFITWNSNPDGAIFDITRARTGRRPAPGDGTTCPEPEPEINDDKNLGDMCPAGASSPSANGSNPINAATGNKFQRETDYVASGASQLIFERAYNSKATTDGVIGARWEHTWSRLLYDFGLAPPLGNTVIEDQVRVRREDGVEYVFRALIQQGIVARDWRSDPDVTVKLRSEPDGSGGVQFVLTNENGEIERYTGDGRLISFSSPGKPTMTFSYDTGLRLVGIHDGLGRTIGLVYDANDRISTLTDPDGQSIHYSYDAIGNLVEVEYADNSVRTYQYQDDHDPHALTGIIDESGRLIGKWTYSEAGRAIRSERAGGVDRVEINVDDGIATVMDAGGGAREMEFALDFGVFRTTSITGDPCSTCGSQAQSYSYDANAFVSGSTDHNGVETRYTKDSRDLELERIEAFGTAQERVISTSWHTDFRLPLSITEPGRETTYAYDSAGRRLSETLRDLATGETRTTRWTYNSAGQVLTMTGPRGEVTSHTYDTAGNLLTVTNALGHVTQFSDYDGHGNAGTITDPNGVVTTLVYDARQRLLSRTTADETTAFAYDGAGRLLRLTQPNGAFVDYEYDAAGRLVAIADNLGNRIDYELDLMGNRTAERVSGSDSVTVRESFSTYDKLNRLINTLGGEGQTTGFEYDALGNPVATTDAFGNATQTRYDALNRVFEQVDALSGVTQYAYNPLDQLTEVTDPRGVTTGYTYNAFGDVLSVASPDAGTTAYAYDTAGNRIRQTDARSVVTEYDYDALNRLVAIRYPDHPAQDITYTWDAGPFGIGRLSRIDDETGSTEYQYDAQGRVTARVGTVRGTTLPHFQEFDSAGNLTALMHPDGAEVVYARDVAGRISGIEWIAPGAEPVPLVSGVVWEPFGGIAGLTYGNGIGHSRTYDLSGRVAAIQSDAVQQLAYQWDATDNITAITDLVDGAKSQSFGYDPLYRLTAASGAYGDQTYGYDAVGNRTALTVGGQVTTYAYAPDSNRLATVDDGTGPVSFAYDAAGNTLSDGSRTFSYDARNRMSQAGDHTYGYNALGQRAFKPRFGVASDADGDGQVTEADLALLQQALRGEVSGTMAMDCNGDGNVDNKDTGCLARKIGAFKNQGQHRGKGTGGPPTAESHVEQPVQVGWVLFAYDEAGHLIGEYDEAGNPIRQYVWLEGMPVAVISKQGSHYLHVDHLNTPKVVTDQQGTIVWQADYKPFGEVNEVVDTLELNLRFPGQYHDRETGLYQNWHREYVPELGRYSQSDPIGINGGVNLYTYVFSNPVRLTDPLGLDVLVCKRPADLPFPLNLFDHYWIKTDTYESGMGGDCPIPGQGCADELYSDTRTKDHSGQSSADNASCELMHNVDEDCVNNLIKPGQPTGNWNPFNQCQSFTYDAINRCRRGPQMNPVSK